MFAKFSNDVACGVRQIGAVTIKQALCKLGRVADPLRKHDPKLRQLRTQHIDRLRSLADYKIPCPVQREDCLLIWRLDLDKPHRRSCYGLTNGRRICCIRLAPFDIRLHVNRRDQLYIVTEPDQLSGPMMARPAGFNADDAGIKTFKERKQLSARNERLKTTSPLSLSP